jgi:glycosyltransferase involved in cell wall biosynthesis
MTKKRVLIVVNAYPEISETYIETERRFLAERYETLIVCQSEGKLKPKTYGAYEVCEPTDAARLETIVKAFRPDVVHAHWWLLVSRAARAAAIAGAPFSVRTHSADVLIPPLAKMATRAQAINSAACCGLLAFPFSRAKLEQAGVEPGKIHDAYPVVDVARFHDESPNGKGILNVGATLPKKNMEMFVVLAKLVAGRAFDIYPIGHDDSRLRELNADLGSPVGFMEPVEHEAMPAVYKKYEWLVCTASRARGTMGWPMVIAEAQASGVGVCASRALPDIERYAGEAAFYFDDIDELAAIVAKPFPEDKRRQGFAQARAVDIARHLGVLETLWAAAWRAPGPVMVPTQPPRAARRIPWHRRIVRRALGS